MFFIFLLQIFLASQILKGCIDLDSGCLDTPNHIRVLLARDNSVFLPRILVGSPSLSTVSGTNYTRDSEERAKSWLNKTVNQGRADGQHNKFITIAMSRIFLNVFLCHEGNLTLDKLLFYFENICCRRHFAGKNLKLRNSFWYCYGKQLNLVPTARYCLVVYFKMKIERQQKLTNRE